jgi:putative ABC transport system permease protein
MFQDLRFSLRTFRNNPGFASIVVLTLALGIGASTTLFTVVDAVLFRPLPFAEPERLVQINGRASYLFNTDMDAGADFMAAKEPIDLFDKVAAYDIGRVNLTGERTSERVNAMRVTSSYFPMVGVNPIAGRIFSDDEQQAGRNHVAVLGYSLWQNHFGGDPGIINRTIYLNGYSYTVIGVMPRPFRVTQYLANADLWVPLTFSERLFGAEAIMFDISGRLRKGVSARQAQVQMNAIYELLWRREIDRKPELKDDKQFKELNRIMLVPWRDKFAGELQKPLLILLGAVGCVLLLACANAANLLLARAAGRQKEAAIRTTLGASRFHLIRLWLAESSLLALVGGALGILLAAWGVHALLVLNPFRVPLIHDIEIDTRVIIFSFAVMLLTGWLSGLLPALHASRPNLNESLKSGGQSSRTGLSARSRSLLTVIEVTLALLLMIGAGLLAKSFRNVLEVRPGFEPRNVLTLELSPSEMKYSGAEQRRGFYQRILERVRALPGVQQAGLANHLPIVPSGFMIVPVQVEGRADTPENFISGAYRIASTDYFTAMGIPLLAGRTFGDKDDARAQQVIIINQSLAQQMFKNENPIGRRATIFRNYQTVYEIIGVVGNTQNRGLEIESDFEFFLHSAQKPPVFANMAIRTTIDPISLAPAVRQAISDVDRDQPVYKVKTMEQHIAESLSQRRFSVWLLSAFAAIALLLAAIGIYGVMSYTVSERTHEIGIRMALGATTRDVLRQVFGQGTKLILIGMSLGLLAAFWLTRFLETLVFKVKTLDPATFVIAGALLILIALLACYLPARRATKVDPISALRQE